MIRTLFSLQLCIALWPVASLTEAKVYESAAKFPLRTKYAFVVVGSGPGGATVASRLSENPHFKVLLIEAGPNDEGVTSIAAPALDQTIPSAFKWNYTAIPTEATANRSLSYARGYVLGGTSSINGMAYTRGAQDDYNKWAEITGDEGWRWESMYPLMLRSETLVPPVSGRNVTERYDASLHGTSGPLKITLPGRDLTDFDQRLLNVAQTRPEAFPFHQDVNSGKVMGIAWEQFSTGGGVRSSASSGFLSPRVRARKNLDILVNTQVTRITPTAPKRAGKPPALRTVELGDRATGRILGTVTASKEVILSAGVINTPHILLNSGIGNRHTLEEVGIKVVHELDDVGRHMSDHTAFFAVWVARTNEGPVPDQAAALAEWTQNKTGPLTEMRNRHLVWSRIPDSSPIWDNSSDPSSGPRTPHVEMVPVATDGLAGAFILLLNPTSRGSVTINSSNPFDSPVVDVAVLKTNYDVQAMKESARLVKDLFSGPAWENYFLNSTFPDPDAVSDGEWEAYIRGAAVTGAHGVGTAAMSKRGSRQGVVDPDLRVKGVDGLRIVDASAIPHVPAGHTQAPIYFLAERASDLIKSAWFV